MLCFLCVGMDVGTGSLVEVKRTSSACLDRLWMSMERNELTARMPSFMGTMV